MRPLLPGSKTRPRVADGRCDARLSRPEDGATERGERWGCGARELLYFAPRVALPHPALNCVLAVAVAGRLCSPTGTQSRAMRAMGERWGFGTREQQLKAPSLGRGWQRCCAIVDAPRTGLRSEGRDGVVERVNSRTLLRRGDAAVEGEAYEFNGGAEVEFAHQVCAVHFGGARADLEPGSDLAVGEALNDQMHNLAFARGE